MRDPHSQGFHRVHLSGAALFGASSVASHPVAAQQASAIVFTPPTGLIVGKNLTKTINAADYVEDGTNTFTCGDATGVDNTKLTSVSHTGNSCEFTIDPVDIGGSGINGQIPITIGPDSNIRYSGPTALSPMLLKRGVSTTIDARRFVSDGDWEIACAAATETSPVIRIASRTDCLIEIANDYDTYPDTPTRLTVQYSSRGGDTRTGVIAIADSTDTSEITFVAPSRKSVQRYSSITIDASQYASDASSGYRIFCTGSDMAGRGLTITRKGCNYTVQASVAASVGRSSFRVNYSSSGGSTLDATISLWITRPSGISFNIPIETIGAGGTKTIDVKAYAHDAHHSYTITCGAAKAIDNRLLVSVARADSTNKPCEYTIRPRTVNGSASFTVPYSSSGGDAYNAVVPITVGPASTITYTPRGNWQTASNKARTITAGNWVREAHSGYTITCGDTTGIDASKIRSVTHTGSSCTFTINPRAAGATAFTIPYTSTGGHSLNARVSISIGPASNLLGGSSHNINIKNGQAMTMDFSTFVSDGDYDAICQSINFVQAFGNTVTNSSVNGCIATFTPNSVDNDFPLVANVFFRSTGSGSTSRRVQFWFRNRGEVSSITYTPPTGLSVRAGETLTINARTYVRDSGPFHISCLNATNRTARLTSVTRDGCNYDITAGNSTGTASFIIPYRSARGDTENATVNLNVVLAHTISVDPSSNLTVGAGGGIDIDFSEFTSTGSGYSVSCGRGVSLSTNVLSLTNNGCVYTVRMQPWAAGSARIVVNLSTGAGGSSTTGTVTINIGPRSDISFRAPAPGSLSVSAGSTLTIDASAYSSDSHSSYSTTCVETSNIHTLLRSVVRPDAAAKPCEFLVTARSTQGSASFDITFRSTGGTSITGTVRLAVGPASDISFAPATNLIVGRNRTLEIDASSYATDGSYSITCEDATVVDNTRLTSVNRAANTCTFTIDPVDNLAASLQSDTSFIIAFISRGGDTHNGEVTVNIGPDSTITYNQPMGLTVANNNTITIDASDYASEAHSGYDITCGEATGINAAELASVNRAANTCPYTVDTVNTFTGSTTFTILYASTGGHIRTGTVTVEISSASTIIYNAPNGLTATAGTSITIPAARSATDGTYTITCGDAADRDPKIIRITNTGCTYQVSVGTRTGTATFTITYISTGGHTRTGTIRITITDHPPPATFMPLPPPTTTTTTTTYYYDNYCRPDHDHYDDCCSCFYRCFGTRRSWAEVEHLDGSARRHHNTKNQGIAQDFFWLQHLRLEPPAKSLDRAD